MVNLSTINVENSSRGAGGCSFCDKQNDVKSGAVYGKKLAAVLQKSEYDFEESDCLTCLRDVVDQARSANETNTPEKLRIKKLACAFQKLINQSKNCEYCGKDEDCDCSQTLLCCVKEMPPRACVQKKYEQLEQCIECLVEQKLQSKCYFPQPLNNVSNKIVRLKKKKSKTGKLVKVNGDCICNSAFCRRKSYRPKWDNSIGPKEDTNTCCRNKCVQSGKHMTTAEMMKWNEKIKKRNSINTKSSTLIAKKESCTCSKVKSNNNEKCKKSTATLNNNSKKNNNKNTSSNKCSCVNRQVQCDNTILDDLDKPSLISVCIQCNDSVKCFCSKATGHSEHKLRKPRTHKSVQHSQTTDQIKRLDNESINKKSPKKTQRSRSAKRNEKQENCCCTSKREEKIKKISTPDEEQNDGLNIDLCQILEKILKHRNKRIQHNQGSRDIETNVINKKHSEKLIPSKCIKIKCCNCEYPTNSKVLENIKCKCSPEKYSKSKAMEYTPASIDSQESELNQETSTIEVHTIYEQSKTVQKPEV